MSIDIKQEYLQRVINIIKSHVYDETLKIYVFGSRATGKAKPYSDLDIALSLKDEKIDSDKLTKIAIELEDSTLPYKVDVIDLNNISNEFKNCIESSLIEV